MGSIIAVVLLIGGFIVLWFSSDKAIGYSTQAAEQLGISSLFVGFVILSLSTGFPELLVAIQALWAGKPMLSVGDIIGSNFIDISLALGIATTFCGAIIIEASEYKKQLWMLAVSAGVMAFIFINGFITRYMGITLLVLYVVGIAALFMMRKDGLSKKDHHTFLKGIKTITKNGILFRMFAYLVLVIVSSKICVDNALKIANIFEIPLHIIGMTIFAVGTSLPEISLNIQAVRTKNYAMALGNSLGSVFNQAALILGLLATFSPSALPVKHLYGVIPFMFAAYALLGFHLVLRRKIAWVSGVVFIMLYGVFVGYEIWSLY